MPMRRLRAAKVANCGDCEGREGCEGEKLNFNRTIYLIPYVCRVRLCLSGAPSVSIPKRIDIKKGYLSQTANLLLTLNLIL